MAAMRSVSLTRQLAMLRSVVVPWAYKRHHGQGHGGIGDVVAVQVNRLAGARRRARICSQLGPLLDHGAHGLGGFTKRISPWMESLPTPSTWMPFFESFWPLSQAALRQVL